MIELARATKIVADGNFKSTVKVKSKDEVGLLSHSFNRMLESLEGAKNAHSELEQRVTLRTSELTATNEQLKREVSVRKNIEETSNRQKILPIRQLGKK